MKEGGDEVHMQQMTAGEVRCHTQVIYLVN